jgi:hypothetical protein
LQWKPGDIAHRASHNVRKRQMMDYGPAWPWAKMIVPISYDLASRKSVWVDMGAAMDSATLNSWFLEVNTFPEGKDPNGTLIYATIYPGVFVFRVSRSKKTGKFRYSESTEVTWEYLPQTATAYFMVTLERTIVGLVLNPTESNDQQGQMSMFKPSD